MSHASAQIQTIEAAKANCLTYAPMWTLSRVGGVGGKLLRGRDDCACCENRLGYHTCDPGKALGVHSASSCCRCSKSLESFAQRC